MTLIDSFKAPRLYTRAEVLQRPSPAPAGPGLYAWFFRDVPNGVPVEGCVTHEGLTLLYVGIAPKPPAQNGRVSRRTLRDRLREHYALNAEGSTLRLTLGCLLQDQLGLRLRRVGSGKRMTFGRQGEEQLSAWMAENAFVCWLEHPAPWEVEPLLIRDLKPPLNLAENANHPFCITLKGIRGAARQHARIATIDAPEVVILSVKNAQLYQPSGREVCISITDPNKLFPVLSDHFLAVLRVAFSDLTEPTDLPGQVLFNEVLATEIVRFAHAWRGVNRVVVHCQAGWSRSPGVAMGLCELFSWGSASELKQRYPFWNKWVRDELVRVGRAMMLE